METLGSQPCMTENRAVANIPSDANGAAALLIQGTAISKKGRAGEAAGDLTCETLKLALSVIQLDIAWHAGLISAEAAMESLNREIGMTIGRCTTSPRSRSPEASNRRSSNGVAVMLGKPCT
jgi:hypothetical protein